MAISLIVARLRRFNCCDSLRTALARAADNTERYFLRFLIDNPSCHQVLCELLITSDYCRYGFFFGKGKVDGRRRRGICMH